MIIDGKKIRDLRKTAGYTQEVLGEKIGQSKKMISFYEQELRIPTTVYIKRIADVFDVKVDYFYRNLP